MMMMMLEDGWIIWVENGVTIGWMLQVDLVVLSVDLAVLS